MKNNIKSASETIVQYSTRIYEDAYKYNNNNLTVPMVSIPMADCIEMLNEYAAQFKSEWVPISERLPEIGAKVLVCRYTDNILMGKLYNDNIWMAFYLDGFKACEPDSVTHWQPLPLPPLNQT